MNYSLHQKEVKGKYMYSKSRGTRGTVGCATPWSKWHTTYFPPAPLNKGVYFLFGETILRYNDPCVTGHRLWPPTSDMGGI